MPREISAVTETLAAMCASHNSKHNSLRELAQTAIDCPGKYLPSYLHPAELRTSREAWYTGFVEAMTLVLKHIDSASPPPRHGTQSKRW